MKPRSPTTHASAPAPHTPNSDGGSSSATAATRSKRCPASLERSTVPPAPTAITTAPPSDHTSNSASRVPPVPTLTHGPVVGGNFCAVASICGGDFCAVASICGGDFCAVASICAGDFCAVASICAGGFGGAVVAGATTGAGSG